MDRTRDADALRPPQRLGHGRLVAGAGRLLTRTLLLLAIAALLACSKLGTDLDSVVALEIVLPDSGRMVVGETIVPGARALNGRGDSVPAQIFWSSLDTAIIVVDTETGATFGKAVGTGRLQARTGNLRSNPQSVVVSPAP